MLTSQEKTKGTKFWNFISKNFRPYEFLGEMEEEQRSDLIDQLSEQLHLFSEDLDLEIGPEMGKLKKFNIIITTGGNYKHFQKAKDLVALAPNIENWDFIALIPPLPKGIFIRINLEDGILDPREMYFNIGQIETDPHQIVLLIGLDKYANAHPKTLESLKEPVAKLVMKILGEESWAINIQYLHLIPIPDENSDFGLIPFSELEKTITEFRTTHPSPVVIGN